MKNIFLTVAALILINCQNSQKETNKFQVATNENKYLDSLIHSKVEHYMIMNTDTFIRVCDSVFIQIPSDCFVDQNGRTHNGKTKLEVCWANSNFDFFLLGLSSLSDKSILETFGMIYLNATTPEGAQLSIKDNKKIKLHFFGEITDDVGFPEIRPFKIRIHKPQGALGISKKITNFKTEYNEENKIHRGPDCKGHQAA